MDTNTRIIYLTNGYEAIVDAEDYEELNKHKWYYSKGYAIRCARNIKGGQRTILMHRVANQTPDGSQTDHINCDKLDNRKANLRTVTNQQNQMNKGRDKDNSSKYKGVSWHKTNKKWRSRIKANGDHKLLGMFKNEDDAARAYNEAAIKYFGEYAGLNIISN